MPPVAAAPEETEEDIKPTQPDRGDDVQKQPDANSGGWSDDAPQEQAPNAPRPDRSQPLKGAAPDADNYSVVHETSTPDQATAPVADRGPGAPPVQPWHQDDADARHQDVYRTVDKQMSDKFNQEHPFAPSGWQPATPPEVYDQALRQSDKEAQSELRTKNSSLEAQMRGTGQKSYRDENGAVQPVIDPETGKPLYEIAAREQGINPDTKQPAWVKRDKYGQKQYETPPLVSNPSDPADKQLYYNFGDGKQVPAGNIDDLVKSKDFKVARTAIKARNQQRAQVWKEAIAPMQDVLAQTNEQFANAQQQHLDLGTKAEQLQAQIDAIDKNPQASETTGGVMGFGGSPSDAATQLQSQRAQLQNQLEQTTKAQSDIADKIQKPDKTHQGGTLWKQQRDAQLHLAVFKAKAAHDNYADLADERRAILKEKGIPEAGDTILQSIKEAQQAYGQGIDKFGAQAHQAAQAPVPDAEAQPAETGVSQEPYQLSASGVKGVGGVSVQALARNYGSGQGSITPASVLKISQRVNDIKDMLADKQTADAMKPKLQQESDYLRSLFAQRLTKLPPDDQKKITDLVERQNIGGVSDTARRFVKGVVEAPGMVAASAGRLAQGAERMIATPIINHFLNAAEAKHGPMTPDQKSAAKGVLLDLLGKAVEKAGGTMTPQGLIKGGEAVKALANKIQVNPNREDSASAQLAEGAGNVVGSLPVAVAGAPGAVMAGSGLMREQTRDQALAEGDSQDIADAKGNMAALAGGILGLVPGPHGTTTGIKASVGRVAAKGVAGAATNTLADVALQKASTGKIDWNRAGKSAQFGGIFGALFALPEEARGRAQARIEEQAKQGSVDAKAAQAIIDEERAKAASSGASLKAPEEPAAPVKPSIVQEPTTPAQKSALAIHEALKAKEADAAQAAPLRQSPQGGELLSKDLAETEAKQQKRVDDFYKAKGELRQNAATDLQDAIKGNQLKGDENVTFDHGISPAADAAQNQLTALDVKLGEGVGATKERSRLIQIIQAERAKVLPPEETVESGDKPAPVETKAASAKVEPPKESGEETPGDAAELSNPKLLDSGGVAKLGPKEFTEYTKQFSDKGGFTTEAHRLGIAAKGDDAAIAEIDSGRESSIAEFKQAMKDKKIDEALALASKAQFFREAKEAATGTGSAVEESISPSVSAEDKSGQPNKSTESAAPVPTEKELKPLPEGTTVRHYAKKSQVIQGHGEPVDHWLVKLPGETKARALTAEALAAEGFKAPEITGKQITEENPSAAKIEGSNETPVKPEPESGKGVGVEAPGSEALSEKPNVAGMKIPELLSELDAGGVKEINGKPMAEAKRAELMNAVFKMRKAQEAGSAPAFGIRISDKLISGLEALRIHKPGMVSAGTPFSLAWDGAIDTAILAIKTGRTVADAVKFGINRLKEKFPNATDEHLAKFESAIRGVYDKQPEAKPAAKAEPTKPAETTGIAHRVSEARGVAAERGEGISTPDSIQKGRELIKGGYDVQKAVEDFQKTKAVSSDLMAAFRAHEEQLSKAVQKAQKEHGMDSPEAKSAWDADKKWLETGKEMQTEWHKTGQAQQGETEIDTGTFHGLQKAYFDASGKDFTKEQADKATKIADDVKGATDEAKAAQDKVLKTAGVEKATKESAERAVSTVKARKPGTPWKPDEAKALWHLAKANYLDKGIEDINDIRAGLATDLGLSKNEVFQGLASPKGVRNITNDMYAKMAARRRVIAQAKEWVAEAKYPGYEKFFRAIPGAFFNLATFGHGTVWTVTHAGNQYFLPKASGELFKDLGRSFKLMGVRDGGAYHERMMQDLIRDPNFVTAKRAGLANDPFKYQDDYQNAGVVKVFKNIGLMGNRGFDGMKLFRQFRFNQEWSNTPESLKTPEYAKLLADRLNKATGITKASRLPAWMNTAFFAPKLEMSRWAFLYGDPVKDALAIAKGLHDKASVTPEAYRNATRDMRQKVTMAGAYLGALALNQALLSATGSKQSINLGNPRSGDWLNFKGFGHNFGVVSPMINSVRFLQNIAHDFWGERSKLEQLQATRGSEAVERAGEYARGKLSPFGNVALDVASQSDAVGRPMPWSNDPLSYRAKQTGSTSRYGYGEYASKKLLPIPLEEAATEIWKSQGATDDQVSKWLRAIAIGVAAGGTGVRVTNDISGDYVPRGAKKGKAPVSANN